MKKIAYIVLTALCLAGLVTNASAEHREGKEGWKVTYTRAGELESNFHTEEYNDPVSGLQPGDDITFTVTLTNENEETADWYMTNEVLHSLEDRSQSAARGGAYSYTLTYKGPTGERELYSSDTVGGEEASPAGVGLHEATSALKDYFYLDTLETGQTAQVRLNVALEGESQGNGYQDTLADLQMNFAVQTRQNKVQTTAVQTGDRQRLVPLYIGMLVSGAGLLVLGIKDIRGHRKGREAQ